MATIAFTFDSFHYYGKLISAGVPELQAKIQVETQSDIVKDIVENQLITKTDIVGISSDIKSLDTKVIHLANSIDAKITNFESVVDFKIKTLENSLLIKLGGMIAVAVAILETIITLVH